MAAEKGPNRLNMKFTDMGRKVVIHLVRGLPPKLSKDKKTITITFAEAPAHQFVRREHLSPKVLRQKNRRNDNPSQQVSEYQLQEAQVVGRDV